jgi:probable HAF family extracellular repeat protein
MCRPKFPARIGPAVLGLGLALCANPIAGADLPGYTITDLRTLGGTQSGATAINNAGRVVGSATEPGDQGSRAVEWSSGGTPTALADRGYGGQAYGINGAGKVVGYTNHATEWSRNGALRDLGTLGGTQSYAKGISDAGLVVGYSLAADNRAFIPTLWSPAGMPSALGVPDGGGDAYAISINDAREAVGYGTVSNSNWNHALKWSARGSITDLGTLLGALGNSDAYAINNAGRVVGDSQVSLGGPLHAVEWSADGVITDLGVLPGGSNSQAFAINNSGQVVGDADIYIPGFGNREEAVIWSGGQISDLNSLLPPGSGWYLLEATAINDHGQIVGNGFYNGQPHGFLLTPVRPP